MSIESERAKFNSAEAPSIAASIGVTAPWKQSGSSRFTYFADHTRFLIVAGPQEGSEVELALAFGLHYRENRRLVLALPHDHRFATSQRAAWLTATAQPELWIHGDGPVRRVDLPTREETLGEFRKRLKDGQSLTEELHDAATPAHLGIRSTAVYELVEWATAHPALDASHRRGEREWQCMGQKVLSIKGARDGLTIQAGIHYTGEGRTPPVSLKTTKGKLQPEELQAIQMLVASGVEARLNGPPPIHRDDEHWLQAVIRQEPKLVGVEQPALRELPAWRPADAPKTWSRGYIDLIGLDGHGDVRIVETKLSKNPDPMLILQGLDYYVWAKAYQKIVRTRLSAPERAEFEIHYVVGDTSMREIHVSEFSAAQADSLGDDIRWRFQTVKDWYHGPRESDQAISTLLEPRTLP
ncbi:MAG TPA: hypothetical protein VGL75_08830 [Acidothermaceae bacterium]|jgi:hypothetical protein